MEVKGFFFLTEGGERLEFRVLASINIVQTELAALFHSRWERTKIVTSATKVNCLYFYYL